MIVELTSRWNIEIKNGIFLKSSALDPRFRTLNFLKDKNIINDVWDSIKEEMKLVEMGLPEDDENDLKEEPPAKKIKSLINLIEKYENKI